MPVFRPSVVVNIRLKFDPELTLKSPPTTLPWPLENPPPVKTGDDQVKPVILQSGTDDDVSWVIGRVPRSLSYEKPGYRQAGKFKMQLAFRELPIDPRTVRAAAVEIHTGTVSGEEFARGFDGSGKDAQGRRRAVLITRNEDGGPNSETLRMVGVVDDWEVEHSDKGSIVMISGRDLRGILLDTPIGPGGPPQAGVRGGKVSDRQLLDTIRWEEPVNVVCAQILSFNPFFEDMRVICNQEDWPNAEIPSPGLSAGGVVRHRLGARKKKKAAPQKPKGKKSSLNFWDLIVQTCYVTGAIPYLIGPDLAIRPSATVFDRLRGPIDPERNPTPFAGGLPRTTDAVSGRPIPPLRARKIVYGRDTQTLRLGRKLGGWRKPVIIRCISVDVSAPEAEGRLRQGVWPPEALEQEQQKARAVGQTPGKDQTKETVLTIPVPGIKDEDRLTEIAHGIYEEIGRGEIGGECTTKNLASFGGDNADPDLLRLEPGDGVEFAVDTRAAKAGASPLISTYTDHWRAPLEQKVGELIRETGIDANLARVILATARGQINELQNFFRVQTVQLSWDSESGVKLSFDFQNYVVTRAQAGVEASAAPGQLVSVTATGRKIAGGGALGESPVQEDLDIPPGGLGGL